MGLVWTSTSCVPWEAAGCSSWELEVPKVPSSWSGQTQKHPGGVQGRGPHVLGTNTTFPGTPWLVCRALLARQ